jgi:hypothetical protein
MKNLNLKVRIFTFSTKTPSEKMLSETQLKKKILEKYEAASIRDQGSFRDILDFAIIHDRFPGRPYVKGLISMSYENVDGKAFGSNYEHLEWQFQRTAVSEGNGMRSFTKPPKRETLNSSRF